MLSNGGTVCDDGFSSESADAICRKMGHNGHTTWTYGLRWSSIQSDLEINMDEVECSSGEWNSCSFTSSHDCTHDEDVFLECYEVGEPMFNLHTRPKNLLPCFDN